MCKIMHVIRGNDPIATAVQSQAQLSLTRTTVFNNTEHPYQLHYNYGVCDWQVESSTLVQGETDQS